MTIFSKITSIIIAVVLSAAVFFGINDEGVMLYEKEKHIQNATSSLTHYQTQTSFLSELEEQQEPAEKALSENTDDTFLKALEQTKQLLSELSKLNTSPKKTEPETLDVLLPVEEVNQLIRPAIVNILCTSKEGGALNPVTGSGIIVDARGVILTNAHIAQYLLLADSFENGSISCKARFGDETPPYQIEPLYISATWVQENAKKITESNPTGTGENDYAFVVLTNPVSDNYQRQETFPFIVMETDLSEILREKHILLASYPAEFLGGIAVQKDLELVSSVGEITDTRTFDITPSESLDVVDITGSIVSQKGSSGGAVVSLRTGKLIGVVSLSSSGETTQDRVLRAITTHHINRALFAETQTSLPQIPYLNIPEQTAIFHTTTGAVLRNTILDAIQ